MSKPSHCLMYRVVPRAGSIPLCSHIAVTFDGTFRVAGRIAKALRADARAHGVVIFYEAMVPTAGVVAWLEERQGFARMIDA